jgi:hypothetical protein
MTSVPCPQQDGGLCNVPDPAVLITDGEFSLIRSKALLRLYPSIESRIPQEVYLGERIHYQEIIQSVAKILTPEVATAGYGEVEDYESRSAATRILETVSTAVGSHDGILVNCSCGHIFTV